jgi:hypothetical protein
LITDSDKIKISEIVERVHSEVDCLGDMLKAIVEDPEDHQKLSFRYESSCNTREGIKVRITFDIEDESV